MSITTIQSAPSTMAGVMVYKVHVCVEACTQLFCLCVRECSCVCTHGNKHMRPRFPCRQRESHTSGVGRPRHTEHTNIIICGNVIKFNPRTRARARFECNTRANNTGVFFLKKESVRRRRCHSRRWLCVWRWRRETVLEVVARLAGLCCVYCCTKRVFLLAAAFRAR